MRTWNTHVYHIVYVGLGMKQISAKWPQKIFNGGSEPSTT